MLAGPVRNPFPVANAVSEFKRYELKFWTDRRTKRNFMEYLMNFMTVDRHAGSEGDYWITSLYLETDDLTSYREKYDGDLKREKYRIRFYNDDPTTVFFEVKHKYNAFVRKSRSRCSLKDDTFGEIPEMLRRNDGESKVNAEFFHAYRTLNLAPMVWVTYRRTALVGRNNPSLRVTFDENLRGCEAYGFDARRRRAQRPATLSRWKDPLILEVKFEHQFPFWLETAMRDFGFLHESISKYGIIMARSYFHERREQWIH